MFKYTIPHVIKSLYPSCTWKVNTRDKVLFLTFDDGPHPTVTPWVLQQLLAYNAKATFFCVGDNVRKFPDTYRQIIEANHAPGNHTMHHLNGWKTPNDKYFENVSLGAGFIQSHLFRPPYGRIRFSQLQQLKKQYKVVMWSKLSRDYAPDLNIQESLHAMKQVQNGDILVFHDSEKAFENLRQLLPSLLDYYTKQGFTFLSLS